MEDSALLETIMVATEAKAEALLAGGRVSGTPTDAVIAACEGRGKTGTQEGLRSRAGGYGTRS